MVNFFYGGENMTNTTLMRMPQVIEACGLKKSAIYFRINEGTFPKPVLLGSKHVAWRSDEIEAWVLSRPRAKIEQGSLKAVEAEL